MPELPEVEVVRRGLAANLAGRVIVSAEVLHPRTARRQDGGAQRFAELLAGREILGADRRGKFLWLPTDDPGLVLAAHLGMSGQFRVDTLTGHPHARARLDLVRRGQDGTSVWFLDQRTFGWVAVTGLVPALDGRLVPPMVAGIALDPFDPQFDIRQAAGRLRTRRVEIKRALLDQSLVAGIGNIYADEALWRARVHPQRRCDLMTIADLRRVLSCARDVMTEALAQGGTSFDSLYVDVNGASGFFGRGLSVYGRQGQPCPRCGTPLVRQPFANRSSHLCPKCQRSPRRTR